MADAYLSISQIASDALMNERVRACAAQQNQLGSVTIPDVIAWTDDNRYVWAASPGWGEKWDSALATHPPVDEPDYRPGGDPAVITDGDILATVQSLGAPAE
jgi:hypothetical protein